MFHLVVTFCFAADPGICADRVLPAPAPMTEADCRAGGAARVAAWVATHDDLAAGAWDCRPTEALPALGVTEIAPGVHVHAARADLLSKANRGDIANLGFVVGDSVAVIDPGGSRAIAEELFAAIRGVTDRPISHVVVTHMHPDHSFGAEVFAEAGAEIIAHRNMPSGLERRLETWSESIPRQVGAENMLGTRVRQPDRTVAAPEEIALGGATLVLVPVATAHTDNDLTAYHVESGTLFTGDLIFADLLPSVDGSILGWLDWLAAPPTPLPRQIVAGHGPLPMDWDSASGPVRAYLTAIVDETRTAIRAGEPMSLASEHIGRNLRGTWRGFDEFNPRNAIAAFKELEWE